MTDESSSDMTDAPDGQKEQRALPPIIPVFPLTGAILLPETQLPLNIFEPRYLKMVRDAHAGNSLIGMIQPRDKETDGPPPLYSVGTVGSITQYEETPDGRIVIVLDGISRFRITQEITAATPYRQVAVDWSPFELDGAVLPDMEAMVDRDGLMKSLTSYLEAEGLRTDMSVLEAAPTTSLIANLTIALPFETAEKQALLEAQTVTARAETMQALFDMAAHSGSSDMAN